MEIKLTQEQVDLVAHNPLLLQAYASIKENAERQGTTESEKNSAIKSAQRLLDLIIGDPAMFRAYESYEKAERDYISGMNGARREAAREAKGEAAREIARNFKAMNVPIEQIAQGTGLTEAQIGEL
jgi:predicted transposase/invertase (TIGR01784 family)